MKRTEIYEVRDDHETTISIVIMLAGVYIAMELFNNGLNLFKKGVSYYERKKKEKLEMQKEDQ